MQTGSGVGYLTDERQVDTTMTIEGETVAEVGAVGRGEGRGERIRRIPGGALLVAQVTLHRIVTGVLLDDEAVVGEGVVVVLPLEGEGLGSRPQATHPTAVTATAGRIDVTAPGIGDQATAGQALDDVGDRLRIAPRTAVVAGVTTLPVEICVGSGADAQDLFAPALVIQIVCRTPLGRVEPGSG